jgi:hypothetical protein
LDTCDTSGPLDRHLARRRAVRGPAAGLARACSTPDHESGNVVGAGTRPRWLGTHPSPDRAGVPCAADRTSASDPGRIRPRRHGGAGLRRGHGATHGWSHRRKRCLQPVRCDPDLLLDSAVDVVELPVVVCRPLGHVRRGSAGVLASGGAWRQPSGECRVHGLLVAGLTLGCWRGRRLPRRAAFGTLLSTPVRGRCGGAGDPKRDIRRHWGPESRGVSLPERPVRHDAISVPASVVGGCP